MQESIVLGRDMWVSLGLGSKAKTQVKRERERERESFVCALLWGLEVSRRACTNPC